MLLRPFLILNSMENICNYDKLLDCLRANSDVKFDEFNNKIVNSGIPTIGCTVPFIRKLAKSCKLDFALSLPVNRYVEVDLLRGIVIANAKLPFDVKSKMLLDFASTIENWAVCDCSTVKPKSDENELYFEFFCNLVSDNRQFVCRYGIVNLLGNYLDSEHIDRVFAAFQSVALWGEYYVDMAAAWLVATAMVKCRDKTVEYMQGEARGVLNKFAYNKALQKMRDSLRVSKEDKQWTYALKML